MAELRSSLGENKPFRTRRNKPIREGCQLYSVPATQAAHAAMTAEILSLRLQLEQCNAELEAEKAAHSATAAALQQEQQHVSYMSSQLAAANDKVAVADALQSFQANVQQKEDAYQATIAAFEQDLARKSAAAATAAASLQHHQEAIAAVSKQLAAVQDLAAASAAALAAAELQLSAEQQQRAAAEQVCADLRTDLATAVASLAHVQESLAATEQQLASKTAAAAAALAAAEAKYRWQKDVTAVKEAEVRSGVFKIAIADAKAKKLQADLDSIKLSSSSATAGLEEQVHQLTTALAAMEAAVAEAQACAAAIACQLTIAREQLSKLQEDYLGLTCCAAAQAVSRECAKAAVGLAEEGSWVSAAATVHIDDAEEGAVPVLALACSAAADQPAQVQPEEFMSCPQAQSKFSALQLFGAAKVVPAAAAAAVAAVTLDGSMPSNTAGTVTAAGRSNSKTFALRKAVGNLFKRKSGALSCVGANFARLAALAGCSCNVSGESSSTDQETFTPEQFGLQIVTSADESLPQQPQQLAQLGAWDSNVHRCSDGCESLTSGDSTAACAVSIVIKSAAGDGACWPAAAAASKGSHMEGVASASKGKACGVCSGGAGQDVAVCGDSMVLAV